MGTKKKTGSDVKAERSTLLRRIGSLEAQVQAFKKRQMERGGDEADGHEIKDALMNALEDYVAVLNKDGIFLQVNEAIGRRFGATRESLVGRSMLDYITGETGKRRRAELEIAFETGEGRRFEDQREGRYFDHMVYPVLGHDGKISRAVVIGRDITRQKSIENALRESEERYRLVTERTSDIVSITTFTNEPFYVYASPSYKKVLGYDPEGLLNTCPFDFIHPEDLEILVPLLERYIIANSNGLLTPNGRYPTERIIFRFKDIMGNWRYLETTGDFLKQDRLLFVSRDVTDRMRAEDELKKARDELEQKVRERTEELENKTDRLREANTALKVLLEMRGKERVSLEENMLFSIKELVDPHLRKIMNTELTDTQRHHVEIIESTLRNLLSPLFRDTREGYTDLTRSEIQIVNLIKFGWTTKEIAEALNLSHRTVEGHRRNIRCKLGIRKDKRSLRSFLANPEQPLGNLPGKAGSN